MVKIISGINPEDVNQSLKHTLFVEGTNDSSFDPTVLSVLFKDISIKIEPLGASFHINSTAKSLFKYHPNYYFLMDRDHYLDSDVEKSWNNFPDTSTHNRIIWRKKELENYFLDPDFAIKSKWFNKSKTKSDFINKLEKEATKRVFYDAVNNVIINIREDLRKNWIELFSFSDNDFKGSEKSLEKLLSLRTTFDRKNTSDFEILKNENIENIFKNKLKEMIDSKEKCKIGKGSWIDLMSGKPLFKTLVNSDLFKVTDRKDNVVQGDEKIKEVAKSLLELSDSDLPNDFIQLKNLIKNRISKNY